MIGSVAVHAGGQDFQRILQTIAGTLLSVDVTMQCKFPNRREKASERRDGLVLGRY